MSISLCLIFWYSFSTVAKGRLCVSFSFESLVLELIENAKEVPSIRTYGFCYGQFRSNCHQLIVNKLKVLLCRCRILKSPISAVWREGIGLNFIVTFDQRLLCECARESCFFQSVQERQQTPCLSYIFCTLCEDLKVLIYNCSDKNTFM